MKAIITICAWALVFVVPTLRSQVTPTFTHSFPFAGCQAVASDGDTVFMSSGSGIYVLDGSADQPVFATSPSGVENKLHAGGFVRDINLAESYVYVAASKRGLVRFERPTMGETPLTSLLNGADAFAVTHQAVGQTDVVLVGTNTGDASGSLELLFSTEASGLELKASRSVGAPVYSIASTIDVANDKLIVLVGTACSGGGTAANAVQEFDFDISGGPPASIPSSPVATWSVMDGSTPLPTLARDIVIDPSGSFAYVAAHTRGVHRLAIGDLAETLNSSWPIECESDACRYQGLSIIEVAASEHILAVGLGLPFPTDRQEWGSCSEPATCADPDTDAEASQELSVQIFSAEESTIKLASISARGADPPLEGIPVRLMSRLVGDNDHFRIDVAALQNGLRVVEASRDELGVWTMEEVGRVDQSFTSEKLPLANVNDLTVFRNTLVAAVESGIVTFDNTLALSGDELLAEPTAYVNTGAIWTAVMESGTGPGAGHGTTTYPAMIFATGLTDGVRFIQPTFSSNDVITSLADMGALDTGGKTIAARAFPAGTTPDGYPWLFVANYADEEATGECGPRKVTGAIRVYRLKKDVHGQISPSQAVQIGGWIPLVCDHPEYDGKRGQLLDLWVEPNGSSHYTIWATNGYDPTELTPSVGVVTIDAQWLTVPTQHVGFTYLGKASVADEYIAQVGRLHYRSGSLFAGFGCAGVATLSASPGGTTTLLKALPISGKSVLGVAHGAAGDTNMYVACINGSILVIDTTTTPMSTLMTIVTPHQPQALLLTSSVTSGPAFYVGDGGGGLHRIQLSATP